MIKPSLPSVHEQASQWLLRLQADDCSAAEQQAFKDWLALDAAHLPAYQHVAGVWQSFSHAASEPASPALAAARAQLRQAQRQQQTRSKRLTAAAALFLAVTAAPLGWQWLHTDTYSTAKGQHSQVTLSDGSQIELNTDTQVRVNYAWQTRQVTLKRGEALFTVAHNPEKPFEVLTTVGRIRDIGTRFNVSLWRDETTVSVLEGEVEVSTESGALTENVLPGQQIRYDNHGRLSALAPFDSNTVTAWQSGLLVFKKTPLSEVLEQMGRYHDVELTIADAKLGELKVSGDFPSNDLNRALDVITAALPVKASRKGTGLIVLER